MKSVLICCEGMDGKTLSSPRESSWRPRSPTPTKMLAWGEEDTPSAGCSSRAVCRSVSLPSFALAAWRASFWRYFSPSDDDDGRRGDGLINRLIEACQMDDVRRAFAIYERLILLQVPLYEGVRPLFQAIAFGLSWSEVYKLIIEQRP